MREKIRKQAIKAGKALGLTGAALAGFVSNAMAAVPAEVTSAFASVSETATGVLALVWPIATLLTVGWVGIKIFKKGANKAT